MGVGLPLSSPGVCPFIMFYFGVSLGPGQLFVWVFNSICFWRCCFVFSVHATQVSQAFCCPVLMCLGVLSIFPPLLLQREVRLQVESERCVCEQTANVATSSCQHVISKRT